MKYSSYRYVKRPIKPILLQSSEQKPKRKILLNVLPFMLCLMGLSIFVYALYPYIVQYADNTIFKSPKLKEIITPKGTDSASVLGTNNVSTDPSNYYQNAASSINNLSSVIQKDHPEYADISGNFSLTIDKIKLKDLPTKINVESNIETEYLNVLRHSLAHFKGSSIPGKPGNTFVYGHSAQGSIFGNSWESIFSELGNLDIGDIIKIQYNGETYKYSVKRVKTTLPSDTSVVLSTSNAQTLTLMTCWLPGIGDKRLIVTADRIS